MAPAAARMVAAQATEFSLQLMVWCRTLLQLGASATRQGAHVCVCVCVCVCVMEAVCRAGFQRGLPVS